jgi:hypothetical protein
VPSAGDFVTVFGRVNVSTTDVGETLIPALFDGPFVQDADGPFEASGQCLDVSNAALANVQDADPLLSVSVVGLTQALGTVTAGFSITYQTENAVDAP